MLNLKTSMRVECAFAPRSSCSVVCSERISSARAASSLSNSAFALGEAGRAVGDEWPERECALTVSPVSTPRSPEVADVALGCGDGAWAAASRGTGDARRRSESCRRTPSSSSSFVAHCSLYLTRSADQVNA